MNVSHIKENCSLSLSISLSISLTAESKYFRVGNPDPFFLDPIILLALFQVIEMLICIINFYSIFLGS